jgi:hypothetical protein
VVWVKKRTTVKDWKPGRFEFLGELHGRPADEFKPGVFAVYRLSFATSPRVGVDPSNELIVYGQRGSMVWPPEQWSRTKPAPGQNIPHQFTNRSTN